MFPLATATRSGLPYSQRMAAMFGSRLLGYYPADEILGANVNDLSGNGRNGLYVAAPTLANMLAPSGKLAPLFGAGQYVNLVTSGLQTAMNFGEWSVNYWAKALNASIWDSASNFGLFCAVVNASNAINSYHQGATPKSLRNEYTAGGVLKGGNTTLFYPSSWFHVSLSCSKLADEFRLRINGADFFTHTGLGTWTGTPTTFRFGGISTAVWSGWLADLVVTNSPVTTEETYLLASSAPAQRIKRIAVLGDSIVANSTTTNVDMLASEYLGGAVAIMNHAVFGTTIQTDMASQAALCANDKAHEIIVALGSNDNNDGDMTALKSTYLAGINTLRASNPTANIRLVNVWPVWNADNTPQEKGNIRAMIDTAGAEAGLTVWHPYEEAWYDVTQTLDKVHPNSAGDALIASNEISRLPTS